MIFEKIVRKIEEGIYKYYRMNDWTAFDLYKDIVFFMYVFLVKIFKGWCGKIVKRGDAQGGITNK